MTRNLDESIIAALVRHNDVARLTALASAYSQERDFFERNKVAEIICKWGNLRLLQAVVATGLEIESVSPENGNSLLHWASRYNQLEVTNWLLEQNPNNIDGVNNEGETALFIAAQMGRYEIASALVGAGASLEAECEGRHTALYAAAMFGYERIVNLLCAAGANVNTVNFRGETPIFWATRYPSIVQTLLDHGSDLNHVASEGDNAAHVACLVGNQESYKLLLENNPEIATMPNKYGVCPCELASKAFEKDK